MTTGLRLCYVLEEYKTALNKVLYFVITGSKNASKILLINLIGIELL